MIRRTKMLKRKIKEKGNAEKGNVILLFAVTLLILIFFTGISLDLGMIYMKRNELIDLCQIVREDRFTYQDTIRYADNPGLTSYQIISDTMLDNNFSGTVKVYFQEQQPESNYRYYRTQTQLCTDYTYTFLRLFGLTTTTITAAINGGETYGEGLNDVVWYPQLAVDDYNGSYTSTSGGGYIYDAADKPADW